MAERRFIPNPQTIQGGEQRCSWDTSQTSRAYVTTTIADGDTSIRIDVREQRDDKAYSERAGIELDRDQAIDLIKALSALI